MPLIVKRDPWRFQPQYPASVDWSNPLSDGLQAWWLPSSLASGGFAGAAVNAYGSGISTDGSSQCKFVNIAYKYGSGVSVAALAECNWRAPNTYERLASVRTQSLATGVQLHDGGSGKLIEVFAGDSALTNSYKTWGLPSAAQTGVHMFAVSTQHTLATHCAYVDGVALTGGNNGGVGNGVMEQGASRLDLGILQYNSANYFGRYTFIGFAALWNRVLSAEEHHSLASNPWQIFVPRRRLIFLPSAGVAMPVLSAPSFVGRVPRVTITH